MGVLLSFIKVKQKRAQHRELRARVSSGSHVPPEAGAALDSTWPQKPECGTASGTPGPHFRTAGGTFCAMALNAPKLYRPNSCCANLKHYWIMAALKQWAGIPKKNRKE